MPFYPALPEYKPVSPAPFTSLIGGFSAGQGLQKQAAETQVLREAAQQPARQREAMAAAQKGDMGPLYTVAPDLAMRLDANKREVANSALDHLIRTGPYINNREQYKNYREDIYKMFPSLSQSMMPTADKFGSDADVKKFMDTSTTYAIESKRRLGAAQTEQDVATAKGVSKEVRIPEARELAKLTLERDLKVQEAYGKIQSDFLNRRIKFDEGVKSEALQGKREAMVQTNFRYEINELQKEKARIDTEIMKLGLPPEQEAAAKQENTFRFNKMANQAADYHRDYATRYNMAWNPPRLPEGPAAGAGPMHIGSREDYVRIFGNDRGWVRPGPYQPPREAPAAAPTPAPTPSAAAPAAPVPAPAPRLAPPPKTVAPTPVPAPAPAPRIAQPLTPTVPGPYETALDTYFSPDVKKMPLSEGYKSPGVYYTADGRSIYIRSKKDFEELMGL